MNEPLFRLSIRDAVNGQPLDAQISVTTLPGSLEWPSRTLAPEWADRLWELARQPERPALVPARTFPIHTTPGQPIGWLLRRPDALRPSGFVWYDRTVPPVDDLLMREIRRSACLALLMEFELRASERENDLIYGSDPSRPAPLTDDEAYAKAEALLQRMIDEGEISFP